MNDKKKQQIIEIVELGIDNIVERQPNIKLNVFNSGVMLDLKKIGKNLLKKSLKHFLNNGKMSEKKE